MTKVFNHGHEAAAYLASQNDTSVELVNTDGCHERWNAERCAFEFKWPDWDDWKNYSHSGDCVFNCAPYTLVNKQTVVSKPTEAPKSLTFEEAMVCRDVRVFGPHTTECGYEISTSMGGTTWHPGYEAIIAYFCERAKTDERYRVVKEG